MQILQQKGRNHKDGGDAIDEDVDKSAAKRIHHDPLQKEVQRREYLGRVRVGRDGAARQTQPRQHPIFLALLLVDELVVQFNDVMKASDSK